MKIRWLLLLGICLFHFNPTFAQKVKPFKFTNNHKLWKDGQLVWTDFQGKPMAVAPMGSVLIYYFFYQPEKIKTADTTYLRLRTHIYMDRRESWVHDSVKTDLHLKYNQILFNCLEWHRRILENKFLKVFKPEEAPEMLNEQHRLLRENVAKLIVETKNGRDEAQVNAWLALTDQKLDSVATGRMPLFKVANLGLGSYIGFENSGFAGEIGTVFNGFSGLSLGSNYYYKNLVFDLYMRGGRGKTVTNYEETYKWPADLRISFTQFGAALGYQVLNTPKMRLIPFAGPTYLSISPSHLEPEVYKKQQIQDYTISYGLQLDWKFRNQVSLIPAAPKSSVNDYGIRFRFFVFPVACTPNLKGTIFNAGASLFLHTKFIKFR